MFSPSMETHRIGELADHVLFLDGREDTFDEFYVDTREERCGAGDSAGRGAVDGSVSSREREE